MFGCLRLQSLLYPKLWMLAWLSSGSSGSQYFGQKYCGSGCFCHVFMEPPRRPWTKIKSINGSGEEARSRRPSGPRVSSSVGAGRRLFDHTDVRPRQNEMDNFCFSFGLDRSVSVEEGACEDLEKRVAESSRTAFMSDDGAC